MFLQDLTKLICLFALGMTAAHAQNPKQTPIKIVVIDAQMRPVPNALLETTFTETKVKSKFFACEMRHTPVKLQCTTDAAGECLMQVPVGVEPDSKTCTGSAILGAVDGIGAIALQPGAVKIEKKMWRHTLREELPVFFIQTNGTQARLSQRQTLTSSATIAASLQPAQDSKDKLVLSSFDAFKLLNTAPLTDRTVHGYLHTITNRADGVTRYELRVDVPFEAERDVMRRGTSVATDPASAVVNGETWALPGVRLVQVPLSPLPKVRFGSPKPDDDDDDDGVREVIAFPLTQSQVQAMLSGYVEGSDGVVTVTLAKRDGGRTVSIPLVEVAGLMKKLGELSPAR